MLGGGARYTNGFEAADQRALPRLHLRAVDRRPRRRRHQGRRRQVPGRAGGLRRLPGRRRLPRPGQRQRRHPRRRRPLPERARGPRRLPGRGRLPRGQRRRPRRRRHPRREGQVPRRARGPRRLPGRRRLPRPGQRQGRHPRQARQVPERPRGQGRLRGRRRLPRSGQRQRRHPRRQGQVPERAGDLQRLRGRGRLPRQGERHHPGQQHRHPRQDQVQDGSAPRSSPSRTRSSTPWRRRSTHHPEFTLIEVAGHADERASDEYNLQLTQDRVNSVMRGAHRSAASSKSRLRSKGYGEFCPDRPGPQRGGVGEEPPRRVQDREDEGRPHGRRARLRERDGAHGVSPEPVEVARLAGSARAVAWSG